METEKDTQKKHPLQNWCQVETIRALTYSEAKEIYDSWSPSIRKRIRRRPAGHFDVIRYEEVSKRKKERKAGESNPQDG